MCQCNTAPNPEAELGGWTSETSASREVIQAEAPALTIQSTTDGRHFGVHSWQSLALLVVVAWALGVYMKAQKVV